MDSRRLILKSCLNSTDCIEGEGKICNKFNVCACDMNFYFDATKRSCQRVKRKNDTCLNTHECQTNVRLKCVSGI